MSLQASVISIMIRMFAVVRRSSVMDFDNLSKNQDIRHGNKYQGIPRATERRCMNQAQDAQVHRKGFVDNFRRSAAEYRKQGQDKIRRCIYPRSSIETSEHKTWEQVPKHSQGKKYVQTGQFNAMFCLAPFAV